MPRIDEYRFHCKASHGAGSICGVVESVVDLVLPAQDFLDRAAGVCWACASSSTWKDMEYELLHKDGWK